MLLQGSTQNQNSVIIINHRRGSDTLFGQHAHAVHTRGGIKSAYCAHRRPFATLHICFPSGRHSVVRTCTFLPRLPHLRIALPPPSHTAHSTRTRPRTARSLRRSRADSRIGRRARSPTPYPTAVRKSVPSASK